MIINDLPVDIDSSRSRDLHQTDHERLHNELKRVIYSGNYNSFSDAIADANSTKRPLVIEPKTHTLTSSIAFNNMHNLNIFAYGARFDINADLTSVIDFKDCVRCNWYGGYFNTPSNRTVDNVFYIYRDSVQATHNTFNDIFIDGSQTVGIRIGKQASGLQCDHMFFNNIEISGENNPNQIGIYAGDGVFGNCLNHTFRNLMLSGHDQHIVIDATNGYFENLFFDTANIDIFAPSVTFATFKNIRSEGAKQFLVTGGSAGYLTHVSVDNVNFHAENLNDDWLEYKLAGSLTLNDINITGNIATPIIRTSPSNPLNINIDSLSNNSDYEDIFTLNAQTTVDIKRYIKIDGSGSVLNIEKNIEIVG